jgi:hypothetical protein
MHEYIESIVNFTNRYNLKQDCIQYSNTSYDIENCIDMHHLFFCWSEQTYSHTVKVDSDTNDVLEFYVDPLGLRYFIGDYNPEDLLSAKQLKYLNNFCLPAKEHGYSLDLKSKKILDIYYQDINYETIKFEFDNNKKLPIHTNNLMDVNRQNPKNFHILQKIQNSKISSFDSLSYRMSKGNILAVEYVNPEMRYHNGVNGDVKRFFV